jgi:opacity protein-like surface antigen
MSRLHFERALFVLLLIVASTTMLQAQTPCPCPAPPCNPPCQAASPSTFGAWEAYLFGGATTHSNNVFKDSFVVNGETFEDRLRMPSAATFGGKIGGFVTENFSIDGNLSWYNHLLGLSNRSDVFVFRPITNTIAGIATTSDNDIKTRALLWEASFNYDFGGHTLGARWTPYVVAGVGGMTARVKNADSTFISGGGFIRNPLYANAGSPVPQFIPNPAPVRVIDNNDTFFTFSYGGGFKALRLAGPLGFRFDVRGRTLPNFFGDSMTWAEFTGGLAFGWGER